MKYLIIVLLLNFGSWCLKVQADEFLEKYELAYIKNIIQALTKYFLCLTEEINNSDRISITFNSIQLQCNRYDYFKTEHYDSKGITCSRDFDPDIDSNSCEMI